MNSYERLGIAVAALVLAFLGTFAFSATFMVIFNLFSPMSPWDTLIICSVTGTFFGGIFGILSWIARKFAV